MEIKSIDTRQLCLERQKVKVVYVESPLLFWVRLRNTEKAFNKLHIKLQVKMAIAKKLSDRIQENQTVAVISEKLWRRGLITRIDKLQGIAQILLKDIGRKILLSTNEIYELDDEFKDLPWQAIACALAHTGSVPSASIWPEETKKFSRLIAEDGKGWMNIVQPLWEGAALVNLQLQSRNFDTSYDFKEALIKLELACHSEKILEHIFPAYNMPGPYYPSETPEAPEEEYDELIDGVRPKDYPATYRYLFELRCVTSLDGEIYQRTSDCYKICSSCFSKVPEEYQAGYDMVPSHNLVHNTSVENQAACTHCYKIMIKVRSADECRGCIGKYLNTDKAYLDEGWGAPVLARWEEA